MPAKLSALVLLVVALTGCPGNNAGPGEDCKRHRDCNGNLQCVNSVCVGRCQRASDCGDGFACDDDGLCVAATGQRGDRCESEVDCAAGLSCQIDGDRVDDRGVLTASCATQNDRAAPLTATCSTDDDCRNGTCALGRCVDLCKRTRDCGAGTSCMEIPRVEARGSLFQGCLLSHGIASWPLPVRAPDEVILFPVPSGARQASLVLTVDDPALLVGVRSVFAPFQGRRLYQPCPQLDDHARCSEEEALEQYYENVVRHHRAPGTAVLAMPSSPKPEAQLVPGAYRVRVSSFHTDGQTAPATPKVTAVLRMGEATRLDLHFHFLDLHQHPCAATFGNTTLNAAAARVEPFFQTDFLGELRAIFAPGGVSLGQITYQDVAGRPALDGLEVSEVGTLLRLGQHKTGVNVFFVRNLSPIGIQAYSPNPGPATVGGTTASGIVIGVDTLCYRTWDVLARITAHELARYMGLYHNVEPGTPRSSFRRDPIDDSDDRDTNLMFYSEVGGTELSPGQRDILTRSPVLQ